MEETSGDEALSHVVHNVANQLLGDVDLHKSTATSLNNSFISLLHNHNNNILLLLSCISLN